MKKTFLAVGVGLAVTLAGCSRPAPPEGAGRATTAPDTGGGAAGGSANTAKSMGADPVAPGAEKNKATAPQPGK